MVARDGTRLATDLYLPRRPGRVPAVIARTPYGKTDNPVWFPAIGRLFADHGMAFVAQDVRGHYGSEGSLAPFIEVGDGWDSLEWITQQPWSDGTTAVFGESYVGFTAIAAASSGHPSLRAAALRNTATDIRGDWLRHQGVLRLEFVLRWAMAAWSGRDNLPVEIDFSVRPFERILPALAPVIGADRIPSVLADWAPGDGPARVWPDDAGWPSLIDQVRVPAHLTTGWWDLFLRGAAMDWSRLAARPGVESRFVAEPTDHAGHDWGDGPTPDPLADFNALADRMPVVLASELAFLRKHLLGITEGEPAAASWILTHVGMQHTASWPPPGVETMTLHLVDGGQAKRGPEGGGLSSRPDRVPVEARWCHDPASLVPALEGEAVDGWFRRPDERRTQVRDDVLTFTSAAFREPLDLAGPVIADLLVRPPAAGGHVMAKLCDVYPEGEARRISDGAFLLRPGSEPVRAAVELGHTGYRVRPGHRLRLEVSSSAFPRCIAHRASPATRGRSRRPPSGPPILRC
ncbi:MAG: CocE/NonD family hydrolase [Chloroflexota bacterium]